jgi:hypothetical protein
MRALAVILAMLPFPALAELPGWWRPGAFWAGEGVQSDGQRWTVEITLGETGALINYPSVPCGGTLSIVSAGAVQVVAREKIVVNFPACISGATVGLRVEAGGSLLLQWSDPTTGLTATAILAPPVS